MTFELPPLPYAPDALEPHISARTVSFHHGRHHAGYARALTDAVARDPTLAGMGIEELVRAASGRALANAAQLWNHTFYWHGLTPDGGGEPAGALGEAITSGFDGFPAFRKAFTDAATGLLGSGWIWLVANEAGELAVVATQNAGTPLRTEGLGALLTCDVWEHAYYLDYQNDRAAYVEAWWRLVDWRRAEQRYADWLAATAAPR